MASMAKTAGFYARIEPGLKESAEAIFKELGIPASVAITMFYRQVVEHNGLPFPVTLRRAPRAMSEMTMEELDAEIQKGVDEMEAGKAIPAEAAFQEIRRELGI